ncbi:hypothetical protein V6N13_088540 [Hibiscus sabdariffa]
MHLGGSFATDPTLSYVGGKVMEWDLDPDTLCYYTLCDMVKEAGYRAVNIKDATRDVTTEVSTTNEQEWVGHVSNETDATLGRPSSEDEEIRDIWVKAKHKKKNLVSDELQVEDQVTFKIHRGQRKKKVNGVTGKYKGKSDESGDETDYVDSSDLGSYDSDLEVFHGPKEFKEALAKYAIIKRFDIVYKRNESKRTRAWCKQEGCPFRIYAGLDKADGLYKIKTFKETHECSITFKNKRANYKYVGKHFLIKLRVLPKLKLNEMQKLAKEELKVDLNIGTCSRARKWAMEEINGRALYEFTRLFDYTYALRKADPIANIELMVERPTPSKIPKFRRFYGKFKGEILTAVGRDVNDQIYPVAWAVVKVENRETWNWFLRNIILDLHLGDGDGFTLMMDQQKGLKEEIFELLPRVEHRVCARHLYANWKKENSGGDLKQEFWAAYKSTTEADFEQHISKIEKLKAKKSLLKTDPKQWSKSYFSTRSDCDATDNNFAIIGARSMAIISLLEEIRQYVMGRIVNNMSKCTKWEKLFCPKICEKLEHNKEMSAYCHVRWNGAQGFEVVCFNDVFVVNLEQWSCSCRIWDLTGIPCPHAIAAILWKKYDVNDYVYMGYKKEMYQRFYSHVLPVVPSEKFWEKTNMGTIEPPLPRKMPGIPKRNRDAKAPASSPVVSASSTPSIILGPTTHVATEAITQAHETTPQAQLHQDQGLFTECRASSTPIAPSYSTPYVPVTPTTNREHSLAPTQIAPSVKSTSSTNQLLMRLSTRGKQIVNGLGLYTDERTGMQILNPGFRGETVITLPKRHAKKRKESNNSDVIPISQESRDMKQTKYKPSS